ncbi:hypothetical protein KCP74_02880 [Salmonella enterica subsp. enterica]|nr:hypothetical protein KCP74_02880 [Salmonella enterica subsp. enterica]
MCRPTGAFYKRKKMVWSWWMTAYASYRYCEEMRFALRRATVVQAGA